MRNNKADPEKEVSKQQEDNSTVSAEEPVIGEIIKKLPPEDLKAILKVSRFEGPSRALLFEKFQPNHITQFLTQLEERDKREYDYSKNVWNKNFILKIIGIIAALGLIVFFTFTLHKSNATLYERLIGLLIAFGIGFSGGYGFGKTAKKSS